MCRLAKDIVFYNRLQEKKYRSLTSAEKEAADIYFNNDLVYSFKHSHFEAWNWQVFGFRFLTINQIDHCSLIFAL